MAVQANFTITIKHPKYMTDAAFLLKVQAVDLSTDVGFPGINLTIINDVSVIFGPGTIVRTFSLIFTPEFIAEHTTDPAQQAALEGLMFDSICTQVPASRVTVAFVLV